MRLLAHRLLFLTVVLCTAANAFAATSTDFYLSLLHRGVSSFEGERYREATTYLKLAAFGFVDSIEQYETAQVYLTLSYDRLGDTEKARDAARRVVAAERIQRRFAAIPFPAGVASSFDAAVTKLLGSGDSAFLKGGPQAPTPQLPAVAQPQSQSSEPQHPVQASAPTEPKKQPSEKPVAKSAVSPAAATPPPTRPAPTPQAAAPAAPAPVTTAKTLTPNDASALLIAGERAIASAQLADARRAYRTLLASPGVSRDILIRVAEGLYRARDFEGSLDAFAKIGALRRGEEPYHYYMAVASFETGRFARAKAEMAAAIPYIEITPDVAKYRTRIESAAD